MIISSFLVVLLGFQVANVRSHCPHMMGVKVGPPAGPSPPGNLPEGDQGWDWDEAGAAPGILPEPHFIQSTYVYRSHNELEKTFSSRVIQVLRQIRERLGKSARLTLENENIECSSQSDHFRCQEFPNSGSWNYFLVEDAKNGAVVYNFERKNNEKNDGTIEMAILDALSRHSPSSLIAFASPEAEKEVGYIRALSSKELESLSSPPKIPLSLEKYGPNELNLIEPALLEVRTGVNLKTDSDVLRKLKTSAEFDEVLQQFQHVFVLFWNKNRMVSLHTFNLWSKIATSSNTVLFCHVACHESPDFCNGLNSDDYNTVVAYKNGVNIGKTANIGDLSYYEQWVELILNEPSVEVQDVVEAKKGFWQAKKRNAVTIGVFRNSEDPAYKHFRIAAEKLSGKYYLAHAFVDQDPTISTYRPSQKQKRQSYSGRFDPASIMDFITKSTLPTIFDISHGFTTDLLLRQKRTIFMNFGAEIDGNFEKLAARQELRRSYNFVFLNSENQEENKKKVFENLGISGKSDGFVILNKDRVHFIDSKIARCPDHLSKLVQNKAEAEAEKVLSTKEPHPLRYLQVEKVNEIFGFEETIVLPDHTLFLDKDPFSKPSPIPSNPSGGCPFMQNGGQTAENHDEL